MTVSCDGRRSVFKGVLADEFPALPINTEGDLLTVGAKEFCDALSQAVGFTSISTVKPEIAGVYLAISKEAAKIVATDSFRLGEKTLQFDGKGSMSQAHAIILPQRAVREIIALFGSSKTDLKIYFSPNQITVEMMMEEMEQPKIQFVTRLIEGEFPDYQAIIPSKSSLRVVFSKKEFVNHIKSASLFSAKTSEIGLKVSQKTTSVKIYSQSADLGEYEGEMKALEVEGEDATVSFNYKFLLDGLGVLNGDKCVLELSGDDGPGVLRSADKSDFIYIVMPIKKN
jgi:DNA polymerase-3 subunit beta